MIVAGTRAAAPTFGVGFSRMTIADPMGGRMLVSLLYPSEAEDGVVSLGPFEFPATVDA